MLHRCSTCAPTRKSATRQGLAPDELLVLDTTRALELRPDCRYDNLHIRPEVLAGSVLRTLVAGLVLWRGRTAV